MGGRRAVLLAASILGAAAGSAGAADDGQTPIRIEIGRHFTSDALDGPVAVSDIYTALRGTVDGELDHEAGETRVSATLEARRYDRTVIEDDVALAFGSVTTLRPSQKVELRGTLTFKAGSDGDDLTVGPYRIGMRTAKATFDAGLQAGVRLADDLVLVVEGGASREKAGLTHFDDALLRPARLEPDRDRLKGAASLMRKTGDASYGVAVSLARHHAAPADLYGDIVVFDHAASLRGALSPRGGLQLSGALGVQALRIRAVDKVFVVPTLELAASHALPGSFSAKGALWSGYRVMGDDDPIASWARRAELEVAYRASPALTFGVGVFGELRDNLGYGTSETERGLYAEAGWQVEPNRELLLRVDASRITDAASGYLQNTIETQIAFSADL